MLNMASKANINLGTGGMNINMFLLAWLKTLAPIIQKRYLEQYQHLVL